MDNEDADAVIKHYPLSFIHGDSRLIDDAKIILPFPALQVKNGIFAKKLPK